MSHCNPEDLSQEFAMPLAQDPVAMDAFGRLSGQKKSRYEDRVHHVRSQEEIQALISELGDSYTL